MLSRLNSLAAATIAAALFSLAASPADAQTQYSSATVLSQNQHTLGYQSVNGTAVDGAASLYSPFLFQGRLYTGGWHLSTDQTAVDPSGATGDDKLFTSPFSSAETTQIKLTPLTINNASTLAAFGGFHLNDPSIVVSPADGSALMFTTCLSDFTYATVPGSDVTSNWVCVFNSTDLGNSWTFLGAAIQQNNFAKNTDGSTSPYANNGAWAPSAIVVGNQIWVYYNTNQSATQNSVVMRTVFTQPFNFSGSSGHNVQTQQAIFSDSPSLFVTDPRVISTPGGYIMTGLDGSGNIAGYTSSAGISWKPLLSSATDGTLFPVLVKGTILTPTIFPRSGNNYDLYFTALHLPGSPIATYPGPVNEDCVAGFETVTTPTTCSFFFHWIFTLNP